jgi:predicted ATPase/transcriptional regulator with XRE-family HTH domain
MKANGTARFGSLLRQHRLAAGLSQAELAERAGLSPDGVGALETGRRASPRLYTVRALADALSLAEDDRQRLFDAAHGAGTAEAAPAADSRSAESDRRRLSSPPQPPTRLIGREREVAEIAFALRSGRTRLLTLTGPGGVGKTRLAIAAAGAIAEAFPDGVAWVELAAIAAPPEAAASRVAAAIAGALGIREAVRQPLAAPLAAAIGSRELALVLDNVEHLLAAAPMVADLQAACPGLAILATSRERLGLRGEREFAVLPLATPTAAESDHGAAANISNVAAVRLFAERAADARGDFALTEANAPAVAELCRRLDGLPLAIELAVGWLKVLPPEALAAQLAPRLPLLTGGAADLPDRQRTLRDTIAWSYELLRPEEQRLFRRLGAFAGGFTVEAADAVAEGGRRKTEGTTGGSPSAFRLPPSASVLGLVAALVDKSLVRPLAGAVSETGPRFGMLETIREFALEQLAASGEEPATRVAHARYCTRLVEVLRRPAGAQKGPLDQLQTEHANVRAALEWLDAAGPAADFVHLVSLLPGFWSRGGHLREGRTWLELALAKAEVAAADDRGRVQTGLGVVLTWQGEYDAAEPLFAAGIPLLRASGNDPDLATALFWHSTLASFRGDHDRAEVLLGEVLALAEAATDRPWAIASMASALDNLGILARDRGDFALAETRLAEALRLRDAHGFDLAAAVSVVGLAAVAYARGDYLLAIARYRESLARFGERGELHHEASALAGVACSAAALGRARTAARLFGAAQEVLEQAGMGAFEPAWQADIDRHIAVVQRLLGDEAFGSAWAEGRMLAWAELMAEVAALSEAAPATPPAVPAPSRRRAARARVVRRRGSGGHRIPPSPGSERRGG